MSLFEDAPQQQLPERARVSILERIVPAFSFGLASVAGIVAAFIRISPEVVTLRVTTIGNSTGGMSLNG